MPLALVPAFTGWTARTIRCGFLEAASAFRPSGSRIECAKERRGRHPTAMLPRAKNSTVRMVASSNYRVHEILAVRVAETDVHTEGSPAPISGSTPGAFDEFSHHKDWELDIYFLPDDLSGGA